MLFVKILAFALCFAVPLGILCGLAAKQARIGHISRFPDHNYRLRSVILKVAAIIALAIGISIHRGTFSFIALGLVAMVIIPTGIIGYLTYAFLMRSPTERARVAGGPITTKAATNGELSGLELAQWFRRNPLAAKVVFWGICALGLALFIHMLIDIASKGKWVAAAAICIVIGVRAWTMAKDKKTGD